MDFDICYRANREEWTIRNEGERERERERKREKERERERRAAARSIQAQGQEGVLRCHCRSRRDLSASSSSPNAGWCLGILLYRSRFFLSFLPGSLLQFHSLGVSESRNRHTHASSSYSRPAPKGEFCIFARGQHVHCLARAKNVALYLEREGERERGEFSQKSPSS